MEKDEKDYCSQLDNIPKKGKSIHNPNLFMCKITDRRCIASSYEDPDPGHPGSQEEAHYDDGEARYCPAYGLPDKLAKDIRLGRILVKVKLFEDELKELKKSKH
jgi:hypothetical protein